MIKVTPKLPDFAERAQKLGRKFTSIQLADGASANISWGADACDCFIVKGGRVKEVKSASGSPAHVKEQLGNILDRLKKFVLPGNDITV